MSHIHSFSKNPMWATIALPTNHDMNYHIFFKHRPQPSGCVALALALAVAIAGLCLPLSPRAAVGKPHPLLSIPCFFPFFDTRSDFNCPPREENWNLTCTWSESFLWGAWVVYCKGRTLYPLGGQSWVVSAPVLGQDSNQKFLSLMACP